MKPDDGRPAKTTRCDKERSESILKKRREQYIGSVINGWKITDVYKKKENGIIFVLDFVLYVIVQQRCVCLK